MWSFYILPLATPLQSCSCFHPLPLSSKSNMASVPNSMPILRVVSTSSGESAFKDDTIKMEKQLALGSQSQLYEYSNARFKRVTSDERDKLKVVAKPAQKSYMEVHIKGTVKITTSDGQSRTVPPGALVSYEDTGSKGHTVELIVDDKYAGEHFAALFD